MDWLNKSAEQNLDEILHLADINARLRAMSGVEKQADVQEMLGNATGAVKDWAGNATNTVKDWAGKLPEPVREFASAIPGHITNAGNAVSGWAAKYPWLAAGIGGAGIGGLGMAALNRFNPDEDERDLAGSLGTGAMMGAGLGLGGMALAKHVPGMLSGLSTPAKTEQLNQQINEQANEQANAPYLTPLAVDAATEGAKNTALSAFQRGIADPLTTGLGTIKNVAANPSLTNAAAGIGTAVAGTMYGSDLAHALLTRYNLHNRAGITDDPQTLRAAIEAAAGNAAAKGGKPTAAARPWYQRLMGVLTGARATPTLQDNTLKALSAIAEGGGSDQLLRNMLYNTAAGRKSYVGGQKIDPGVIQNLVNSRGYTGRANTPLRYEAATAARSILPENIANWLATKPSVLGGQLRAPMHPSGVGKLTPFRAVPSRFINARRMGGARGLAALAALYGLNHVSQGQ